MPEIFAALFRLYEEKKIHPVVYRGYPLEEARGRARGARIAQDARQGGPQSVSAPLWSPSPERVAANAADRVPP